MQTFKNVCALSVLNILGRVSVSERPLFQHKGLLSHITNLSLAIIRCIGWKEKKCKTMVKAIS